MVSDDQVSSCLSDLGRLFLLCPVQLRGALRSPMDIHHHIIAHGFRLRHLFQEQIHIAAAEYAGRILRSAPGGWIVHPFDLGRGQECDLYVPRNEIHWPHRFRQVSSRAHIGHADGRQGIQGIQEGNLPVIICMVIGQRNDIRTHIQKKRRMLRPGPKGKFLILRRHAPVRVSELIVHHEYIRTAHGVTHGFVKGGFHIVLHGFPRPVFHLRHDAVAAVKQDIPCKSQGNLIGGCGNYHMDVIPGHRLRISQDIPILSRSGLSLGWIFHISPRRKTVVSRPISHVPFQSAGRGFRLLDHTRRTHALPFQVSRLSLRGCRGYRHTLYFLKRPTHHEKGDARNYGGRQSHEKKPSLILFLPLFPGCHPSSPPIRPQRMQYPKKAQLQSAAMPFILVRTWRRKPLRRAP